MPRKSYNSFSPPSGITTWSRILRAASQLGDRRWNDRWPDVSLAAHARRHEHDKDALARLRAINRAELSAADQLNYDLFLKERETDIEEYGYRWYLVPLNQRGGIQICKRAGRLAPL